MSLFLLQLLFACNLAFYINIEKKPQRNTSSSSICICYYRKHPNSDNKICPLPSSACFQDYFHDWFSVLSALRYNLDLAKLCWTLLLFNFNKICDLTNRRKLFAIPVTKYASFPHQARTFKTNVLGLLSNFL